MRKRLLKNYDAEAEKMRSIVSNEMSETLHWYLINFCEKGSSWESRDRKVVEKSRKEISAIFDKEFSLFIRSKGFRRFLRGSLARWLEADFDEGGGDFMSRLMCEHESDISKLIIASIKDTARRLSKK